MKRGSYFQYMRDPSKVKPYTTLRSQNEREQRQINAQGDNSVCQSQSFRETPPPDFEDNEENHISTVESEQIPLPFENDVQIDIEQHRTETERTSLYPGARITRDESNLLIMQFMISHGLTEVALQDLLHLINLHLPCSVLPSKYLFLKNFPPISDVKSYYYCPKCLIEMDFNNVNHATRCLNCGIMYAEKTLRRNGHFFVYIPLKDQLSNLLSSPLYFELNRGSFDSNIISDVTSGKVYKTLKQMGVIGNNDITIQWNADGVQTFNSSKVSMCPIQVSINELNYNTRRKNIILVGLWASAEKPVFDLFLKPFVAELKDLHENGFTCLPPLHEEINMKVHVILAPVDSVARCALVNIHQYNGVNGCTYCLHPGERVPTGKGFTRVYKDVELEPRTMRQHVRDAIHIENGGIMRNGVKGVSALMLIPVFNIMKCLLPDYMHCVLLGVTKLYLTTWIDPNNWAKPWYIGSKANILDEILQKILLPCEITRTPRSVSNIRL